MISVRTVSKDFGLLPISILLVLVLLEPGVRLIEPCEVMRYVSMSPNSSFSHLFILGASGHCKRPEFDVGYLINTLGLCDREIICSLNHPASAGT